MKNLHHYMVVDDDPTNNLICEYIIKGTDDQAEFESFIHPEEALKAIEERYSQSENLETILFLDINMPTMTGWDFLDVFKNFQDQIKNQLIIYILTSSIESFSRQKEQYPFVAGFLSKPLKKEKLQEIFAENQENEKNEYRDMN
ncbi:response regulator [Salegentibacter sp. F188]|uniref:Response regulator n=1 Tax=Autumnicola patrickiae TaxID=3075591 RepID=A0ABU3DXB4_9FLAO|nr:response regulator [Salegentibacter sp. F188]MDT0688288.1 response regulator [Salegentibacter sp. F188]